MESTWDAEAKKWDHTRGLKFSKVLGSEDKRLKALKTPAHIYLINRENIPWLVKIYGNKWPFDTVVVDEFSSFKNSRSNRWRALKSVRKKIKRLYGLTGTPASNGYEDLWAQIYLLDGGERLEKFKGRYLQKYFRVLKMYKNVPVKYGLKEGAREEIQAAISDICTSMSAEDYLELPELIEVPVNVKLPGTAMKKYKELVDEFVTEIGGAEITAKNAAVLSAKLLQVSSGAAYMGDSFIPIHNAKLEAVKELVDQARAEGENVLILYWFKFEPELIKKALKGYRVKELGKDCSPEEWNNGKAEVLLAQPASSGYGLNLQKGGHICIFTTPCWSLEVYQQSIKRLHRQGQEKPVIIYQLQGAGIDKKVYRALNSKEREQDALLEAIKEEIHERF